MLLRCNHETGTPLKKGTTYKVEEIKEAETTFQQKFYYKIDGHWYGEWRFSQAVIN